MLITSVVVVYVRDGLAAYTNTPETRADEPDRAVPTHAPLYRGLRLHRFVLASSHQCLNFARCFGDCGLDQARAPKVGSLKLAPHRFRSLHEQPYEIPTRNVRRPDGHLACAIMCFETGVENSKSENAASSSTSVQ